MFRNNLFKYYLKKLVQLANDGKYTAVFVRCFLKILLLKVPPTSEGWQSGPVYLSLYLARVSWCHSRSQFTLV